MSFLIERIIPLPFPLRSSLKGLKKPLNENWTLESESSSFVSVSTVYLHFYWSAMTKIINLFFKNWPKLGGSYFCLLNYQENDQLNMSCFSLMIRQTQSKTMVRLNEFVIRDILTSFGFSKFFDCIQKVFTQKFRA